eukprot:scaffold259_cov158-Amphora_coffeaeformis.AAC.11
MESTQNAMELNNIGVSFLQKGHISKAIKTFKTLTMALARREREPRALPDAMSQAKQIFSSFQEEEKENLVQIMPIEDNDECARNAASYYGSSSSVAFPLRLMHDENDSTPSTVYITAVALYNHGVAVQCRYANHQCQARILTSAEKSLRTAKMILRQSKVELSLHGNDYRWNTALSLITNVLQQVLCEQELFISREQDAKKKESLFRPAMARFTEAARRKVQMRASAA